MVDRPSSITVELFVPPSLLEEGGSLENVAERARVLWLVDLVRTRQVGVNRAAREAGMPLLDFYKVLQSHGVPSLDLEPEELDRDLAALERFLSAS